jgi:hypothetical protein
MNLTTIMKIALVITESANVATGLFFFLKAVSVLYEETTKALGNRFEARFAPGIRVALAVNEQIAG